MRLIRFKSIVFLTMFLGVSLSTLCQGIRKEDKRGLIYFCGSCIGLATLTLPKEYAFPVLASSILVKVGIALNPYANQSGKLTNKDAFLDGLLRGAIVGSGMRLLDQHIRDKKTQTFVEEVPLF